MAGGSLLLTPNLFKKLGSTPSAIITVNGRGITQQELQQKTALEFERFALLRQQLGQYADSFLQSIGMNNPQEVAVNSLIVEALLDAVVDAIHLRIAPEFVVQKLQDPAFVVRELRDVIPLQAMTQQGHINMPFLKYYLEKQGLSLGNFEQLIEKALKRKMVSDIVKLSVYVSNDELNTAMLASFARRNYGVARLEFNNFLKEVKTKPLSQEELATFFAKENATSKRYWVPEERAATVWKFAPTDYGITIDDKEVAAYYNTNKQKFIDTPLQVEVRRILFKIADKADVNSVYELAQEVYEELTKNPLVFAQRAQEISEDTKTASKGGLVEPLKKGEKDPAFERAAFRLQEDGQISEIITTNDGLEIIQRVSRKPATYKSLDAVKKDIQTILLKRAFAEQFTNEARSLIDKNNTQDELQQFAKQKNATKKNMEHLQKNDSLLAQKIFKTARANTGYFIDEQGNGVITAVSDIQKTYEPTLENVKKRVEEDLYTNKAHAEMQARLAELKKMAQAESLKKAAEKLKISYENTGFIQRDDTEKLDALGKKGIPVASMLALTTAGSLMTAQEDDHGYVIQLEEVMPLDSALIDQKKRETRGSLMQEKKELLYRGYIASLYRNATIKSVQKETNDELPMEELP